MRPRIDRAAVDHYSRRWWPVGAATLAGVVAVGVAVLLQPDDAVASSVGEVVQAGRYDQGDLTESSLQLPTSAVEVGVGTPVTDLAGREAPDDGSFVAVSVEPGVDRLLPSAEPQPTLSRVPVSVELVADGRRYPVPADPLATPDRLSPAVARSAWVAVAGRPSTVSVAITFDGVRQTVTPKTGARTTGRAAPLYARSAAVDPSCGTPTVADGFRSRSVRPDDDCTAVVRAGLAWLPDFGWAAAGRSGSPRG